MKKLLFAAFAAALVAGCTTTTPVMTPEGKELRGANGKVVTMESEDDARQMTRAVAAVERSIAESLRQKASSGKFYAKYNVPSDAELRRTAGGRLTAEQLEVLRKVAEDATRKFEREVVWPKWIDAILARAIPAAEKVLAKGDYAAAREIIWCASTTGVADVDEGVRKAGYEFLNTRVNPQDWYRIEGEIMAKFNEMVAAGAFEECIAFLESYPRIRTFSVRLDARLDDVKAELVKLGVKGEAVDPAVAANLAIVGEVDKIIDLRDQTTNAVTVVEGEKPDLTDFEAKLTVYRDTLVRFNATEPNADMVKSDFRARVDELLNQLYKAGSSSSEAFLYLGTTAVNRRIDALTASLIESLRTKIAARDEAAAKAARAEYDAKLQAAIDELVKKVVALVEEKNFDEARAVIRDYPIDLDANRVAEKWDYAQYWNTSLYLVRIGLLNSIVNPKQYDALVEEIDAKVKEFMEAKDYAGLEAYVNSYPGVHDAYADILAALEEAKAAMPGLTIGEEAAGDYIASLEAGIQEFLEKRVGAYTLEREYDFTELEKALAKLDDAFYAQYCYSCEAHAFRQIVHDEIERLIPCDTRNLTTWQLNELLRAYAAKFIEGENTAKLAKLKYAKMLDELDEEVSFDAQIAMAEEAVSRQVGIVCPKACMKMNAVMGDYARIFRVLQTGAEISSEEATTLLVGAAYLDQTAVFDKAMELGADLNAPARRDPVKRPALLVAIECGNNAYLAKINAAGGDQTVTDADGNTALHYAMKRGNLAAVRAFLKAVDPKAVNIDGETAIFTAVRRNQAASVKFFVDEAFGDAADDKAEFVNTANAEGDAAFQAACKANAHMVLDVLEAFGAEYGQADLVEAAGSDRLAIAQWLVEHCLDVNGEGVMEAAFGEATSYPTATYKYLVSEGGVPMKRLCSACEAAKAEGKPCNCSCGK